jgi:hypothetical protein
MKWSFFVSAKEWTSGVAINPTCISSKCKLTSAI